MRVRRKLFAIALSATLVLAFGLLRIRAAYQNEQKAAILRATQASAEADREQRLADEDNAKTNCSLAWQEYHIAEQNARLTRLKQGEIAYLDAERRVLSTRPLCDGYELSLQAFSNLLIDNLDHSQAVITLRGVALAERQYALDRKLQTRHIFNRTWGTVTGATAETPTEWLKFLSENYPKVLELETSTEKQKNNGKELAK